MRGKACFRSNITKVIETGAAFNGKELFKISDNFLLDQNLEKFNKNQIELGIIYPSTNFNLSYLEESEHIGNTKYIQTKAGFNFNNGLISLGAKRNLLTNSAEFYDLSYEYINDCLRAGIVYRREFYNDSELEAENSLMFNITLTPFGNINSPKINK